MSEAQIQSQIVNYLAAGGIDAIAIPNGSHIAGDKASRARKVKALKRTGMLPGMSDLVCFDRRARRVCLFEVKSKSGQLQPSQVHFAEHVAPAWGWPLAVVRSVEDVANCLREWGWR